MFFIIKGFQTIVFIFIVISTTFRSICPPAFFRCLSNSGTYTKSTEVACSDSVSHNWIQMLFVLDRNTWNHPTVGKLFRLNWNTWNHPTLCKLFGLDRNTWNHPTLCKLFGLDRNTWKHPTVCKLFELNWNTWNHRTLCKQKKPSEETITQKM